MQRIFAITHPNVDVPFTELKYDQLKLTTKTLVDQTVEVNIKYHRYFYAQSYVSIVLITLANHIRHISYIQELHYYLHHPF